MLARFEQLAGVALILVTLADIFLNVLYARAGIAIFSRPLAHAVRNAFTAAGKLSGRRHARVLSFCGPVLVVVLLLVWVAFLITGSAMIVHPALGHAVRSSMPGSGDDFVTALNVAGGTIASVGPAPFAAFTAPYKLLFLWDGFMGISVVALVITYLMQLYAALQARDELALKVELMTAQTGDAARLVAGLFPHGHFEAGLGVLTDFAAELSGVKEAHHLYPVLFYFRFPQPYYELSRFTLVLLEAVAFIRTALDEREAGWVKRLAVLEHLERGGLVMIDTLHRVYLRDEGAGPPETSEAEMAAWRRRYVRGLAVLRDAGLPVRRDVVRGCDAYIALRSQWHEPLIRLGAAIGHRPEEIDPALHVEDERPAARAAERRAAPAVLH
jgi:hypothetical protein